MLNDQPSSVSPRPRLSPSPKSGGVPLAKISKELQAARQLTSKALTVLQSDENTPSSSEGKGDARSQAATSLYPSYGGGSAKTLLDYYSAQAAERRSDQHKNQYAAPRVTMSFFPSRDTETVQTPAVRQPPAVANRASAKTPQGFPRRMPSAADGEERGRSPAGGGEQSAAAASTTRSGSTSKSTVNAHADTTEQTGRRSAALKPVERRLSEPSRVATPAVGVRPNTPTGAATDVFLSSILSHFVPQTAEKDWGHFTLLKPAKRGQTDADAKPAVATITFQHVKKSENRYDH